MVSRVLGFVRDQLIAFTLGTGPIAEAFFVAQRFPNLFRALFAEGAFNNAFVPLFAKRIEGDGEEKARAFAIEVFSVLLAWLLLFSAAAMVAMPLVIYVIAPGFKGDDAKVPACGRSDAHLLSLSAVHVADGAAVGRAEQPEPVHGGSGGADPAQPGDDRIQRGGLVSRHGQLRQRPATSSPGAFSRPVLRNMHCWPSPAAGRACRCVPRWPRLTPDVKRVIALSVPGIVSGGVMQINLVVATMIATTIDGAVAYLYYADRLYQLPLGVIGVAIGVVLLPDLSRKLRAGNEAGALNSQNRALELSMFLTLPSAIALMAIPAPIIHTVFEHGAFTRADTLAVAPAVLAFASGLPAFSLTKVFQPGFYAREDTRTPMRFAIISVVVNVAASLVLSLLVRTCGHRPGDVARGLGQCRLAGLHAVSRRGLFTLDERSRKRLPRIVASALVDGRPASWRDLAAARELRRAGRLPGGGLGAATARHRRGLELFCHCARIGRHATWRNQVDAETLRPCR